jgi:putative phage-type endonuclease
MTTTTTICNDIPSGLDVDPHVLDLLERTKGIPAQLSDEWFEMRKNMLTCSLIASVLGQNPYQSRRQIFLRKTGRKKNNSSCAATRWGTEKESIVCEKYMKQTGNHVFEFGLFPHPDYDWLGGSPDGITANGILIEIKCPYSREIVPGEVPKHYIAQIQTLMQIFDLKKCHFVQWKSHQPVFGKEEVFDITEVDRDDEWWTTHYPIMRTFWNEVMTWRRNREKRLEEIERCRPSVAAYHIYKARGKLDDLPAIDLENTRRFRMMICQEKMEMERGKTNPKKRHRDLNTLDLTTIKVSSPFIKPMFENKDIKNIEPFSKPMFGLDEPKEINVSKKKMKK